jgi:hypothetical protein
MENLVKFAWSLKYFFTKKQINLRQDKDYELYIGYKQGVVGMLLCAFPIVVCFISDFEVLGSLIFDLLVWHVRRHK